MELDIDEFLGDKWLGKYTVGWCDLCGCAYIRCPKCENISCNGGGCEECIVDDKKFSLYETRVESYLTEEERKIYDKVERLKKFIIESIRRGDLKIDFKALQKEGKLSPNDEEMFARELL